MKEKNPTRVCEVPGMLIEGNRHVYVEAFPNEPKKKTEAEAVKFMRGLRNVMSQRGIGTRHTESGLILPN